MESAKKVVMVVEDEKLLVDAISKKLLINGFDVCEYTHGISAITALISHTVTPDIIWLDYYLGDMNGLEFVTEMQKHGISVPVVIVSNSASDTKVKTMLALGVKKYLLKAHFRLEEIISELHSMLKEIQ